MRRYCGFIAVLGLAVLAAGSGKPLARVPKFDGKFLWIKLGDLPAATLKPFAGAKSFLIDVSVSKPITVKADAGGHTWFTFILADQGSDWKWHQTTGNAGIPVNGGVIRPGTYTLVLPVAGIPSAVLHDKKQTISLGPSTSGLPTPAAFTINRITAK